MECKCVKIKNTLIKNINCNIHGDDIDCSNAVTKYFDFKELAQCFKDSLKYGDSLRKISKKIGVSASTLSRVTHGKTIDIDTCIKVCDYINISIQYFIKPKQPK